MDKLIQTIQDEINQLMKSKIAKSSDKQLEYWANHETPYETVMEMYQLHLSGVSLAQVTKQYGYGGSNIVTEKFDRHGLKYEKHYHTGGKHNAKPIEQYSLNGEYIQTFESATKAAELYNCHISSILGAVNGKQKTSCGFIWKFKNQPVPLKYEKTHSNNPR
jgi:hypothetical protein